MSESKDVAARDVAASIRERLPYKSVVEISQEFGVSPQLVLEVKKEALYEQDALTLEERRTLAIQRLEEMSNEALSRARNIGTDAESMRNFGPTLTSAVQAIKTVLAEVKSLEKNMKPQVEKLNELRVQELKKVVSRTIEKSVPEICRITNADEDVVYSIFMKAFMDAALEIDSE